MTHQVLTPSPGPRLRALLLGYLEDRLEWPGGDGVTVEEVLQAYPVLARMGQVPNEQELRQRHAELAGEVEAFFVGDEQVQSGTVPGRRISKQRMSS